MEMTESQVLERIADKLHHGTAYTFIEGEKPKYESLDTYSVNPEKLAALLAEMSNRIEQLENKKDSQ